MNSRFENPACDGVVDPCGVGLKLSTGQHDRITFFGNDTRGVDTIVDNSSTTRIEQLFLEPGVESRVALYGASGAPTFSLVGVDSTASPDLKFTQGEGTDGINAR